MMFNSLAQSSLVNLFIGIVFVIFGALFLLSNYGIIPEVEWNKVWPLILVLLGLTFLLRGAGNFGSPRQPRGYWD